MATARFENGEIINMGMYIGKQILLQACNNPQQYPYGD
jgi:hypothetical protein